MDDAPLGSLPTITNDADWLRLILFMLIAVYGTVAVAVFDSFWPKQKPLNVIIRNSPPVYKHSV